MNIPKELLYTDDHEWVFFSSDDTARIGITDFAQTELGDIVFINLPEEEDTVVAGDSFAEVESVKAVSDIYSPVTGVIRAINRDVLDNPSLINETPYEAWLIEVGEIVDKGGLMSADEYENLLAEGE